MIIRQFRVLKKEWVYDDAADVTNPQTLKFLNEPLMSKKRLFKLFLILFHQHV